ncbi:type I-E CRISPR-associated protein Cas5/CasD [Streptomyces zhihengii]|uniref:Type I-E CRISPR-associated protein Cas5/CasD n=1 Tax=Streptomyces zhihengii TaxID=1818004 RepID=A0ABS2V559_9ACTN|nr:type I-E CRISPR-associated protein Cas5/CasD [Streptomyces zhihengii]MBM9624691.1 type I-E CRISPR-associated protein Cas5/CasD [Streptomyces zhihengii]
MSGFLLRLAGPLQSWGERSAFAPVRDTAPFPTRSALIGMFAAAEGIGRHDGGLDRYQDLHLTVRVDRPGVRLIDYHTAGGGFPKERTPATSAGSNKGAAVITRRHYLSDAVFVVAVTTPDPILEPLTTALCRPHWAPYLGRRSCVPDEPFLLRRHVDNPEEELRTRVPLSRPAPRDQHGRTKEHATIQVEFLREQQTSTHPAPHRDHAREPLTTNTPGSTGPGSPGGAHNIADIIQVNDVPISFAPHQRAHTSRHIHRTLEPLPSHLAGPQHTLIQRLIDYAHLEDSA